MASAMRTASRGGERLHLMIVGRGSSEIRPRVEAALAGSGVCVTATGILPADQIARRLSSADALLFVSGCVAQTRGTALAAVACGIPIVGYAGAVDGSPLVEAGLELAPYRNREALAGALARVMGDATLRNELRRRSAAAYRKYFSWDAIAEQYAAACLIEPALEAPLEASRGSSLRSPGIS